MALDFDDPRADMKRGSLADATREARGMARAGMNKMENGVQQHLGKELLEIQQNIKEQSAANMQNAEQIQSLIVTLRAMADDLHELIEFQEDNEDGIRASIQATSSFVIEEEAEMAKAQIRELSAQAKGELVALEQESIARVQRLRATSKTDKIWKHAEHATTAVLLLFLLSCLVNMWI